MNAFILHHYVMYVNTFYIIFRYILHMELSKKIGQNLKEARKFKGMTQKETAAVLRMTQQQYSRFENGVYELNYDQIVKLCVLYDITPNELFHV